MYLPIVDVVNAIAKAQEFDELYKHKFINGDGYPRSVEGLEHLVKDWLHPKKVLRAQSLKQNAGYGSAKAAFFVEKDGYKIVTQPSDDDFMNRLTFCKELFHVILDDEQSWCRDIADNLTKMLVPTPDKAVPYEPATASEWLALIAAMEFLFPFTMRLFETEKTTGVADKFPAIADFYKVPQAYVELYMSPMWVEYLGAVSRLR